MEGGGGCGTAGRGDLQGEGPTDAWRVTGLVLEAGGFRGSPSRSWPYCQYVSSWAWGSHFLALGCPCWWPSFLPCLHYAVTFSHRGSIWSLCQPDWLIRAALHVSGRGGGELAEWAQPAWGTSLNSNSDLVSQIHSASQTHSCL